MFSDACVQLVKQFEGCKLTAYKCPAGVWTIGFGHTGKVVTAGLTVKQDQADKWLEADLKLANSALHTYINCPLKQCQEDALTSFIFNVGATAFERSSLRRFVNKGMINEAADEFLKWDMAAGKHMVGLAKRRAAERKLFLGE